MQGPVACVCSAYFPDSRLSRLWRALMRVTTLRTVVTCLSKDSPQTNGWPACLPACLAGAHLPGSSSLFCTLYSALICPGASTVVQPACSHRPACQGPDSPLYRLHATHGLPIPPACLLHLSPFVFAMPLQGGIATAVQHHGKEMSYNNYLDADAAYSCCCDFKVCVATVCQLTSCQ